RRWARTGAAAVALLASAALVLLSMQLSGTPRPGGFYSEPADVPDEPGRLLRSEPFTRTIPAGATAWRILYTTTLDEGRPAVASALVVVPESGAHHPVIAWSHGTTGYGTGCAPSLLDEPFVAGAMPDLDEALASGWAVVATDYPGLGTEGSQPYLIGQGEGRSVLDAVRAAQQLTEADVADETVIWGHSQGGHAALWAGGLAAEYAPELDIAGVAAMAPASNLPALLDGLSGSAVGSVFGSFALAAYVAEYPDVHANDYVRPGARIMMQSMQQRCLTDPSSIVSIATAVFSDQPVWSTSPGDGPLGARAEQNVPVLPIDAPLLVAQGETDPLVLPSAQAEYVDARCAAGQRLDYRTYPGRDHMGVVTGDSPLLGELVDWTAERFAGEPAANTCAP
ncbi:MAG: alpha/beta fold hydrolase, partial [Agromyces sp.]